MILNKNIVNCKVVDVAKCYNFGVTWILRFGLKSVVRTAAVAIHRDRNNVEAVEADID
jgi:hypothetical protein